VELGLYLRLNTASNPSSTKLASGPLDSGNAGVQRRGNPLAERLQAAARGERDRHYSGGGPLDDDPGLAQRGRAHADRFVPPHLGVFSQIVVGVEGSFQDLTRDVLGDIADQPSAVLKATTRRAFEYRP
jgi:hypothetical protein